jgi:hypothetical protein
MLDVIGPVTVKAFLGQNSLFIEETLSKGMILFFYSFGFSFSDTHIQTSGTSFNGLSSHSFLDGWNRGDAAPLA